MSAMSAAYVSAPDESVVNRNVTLLEALGATFLTLSLISTALRIWVRTGLIRCWGRDDWVMLLTQASFIAMCGLLFKWTDYQKEARSTTLSLESFSKSYDFLLIETSVYLATIILLKISLAMFFLRFVIERWARMAIWAGTIAFSIWSFALVFYVCFYCGVPKDFLIKYAEGKCTSGHTTYILGIVWGSFNAVTDWIIALVPLYFVIRSRITTAAKITVCTIMAIAVVGSSAGIVRVIYYKDLEGTVNYWVTSTGFQSWSVVEPGLGIFAANLATLRPLFEKFTKRSTWSIQSSRWSKTAGGSSSGKSTSNNAASKPRSRVAELNLASGESTLQDDQHKGAGLDFVTAKTFDDDFDAMEKGQS